MPKQRRRKKNLEEIRATLRECQAILSERFGVQVAGVFGSYVKGEQDKKSDLDLLVEIVKPISLLELIGAELYLSDLLGLKVDLVPKRSVREELRQQILQEAVSL